MLSKVAVFVILYRLFHEQPTFNINYVTNYVTMRWCLCFIISIFICSTVVFSCQKPTSPALIVAEKKTATKRAIDFLQSNIRPGEKLQLGTIYTDDLEYISFSDDYDDSYILFKKGKDSVSLIYNEEQPAFVHGDRLRVRWKMDSLRPAGDPEFLDFVPFVVSARVVQPLQLKNHKTKVLWRNKESAYHDLELNHAYLKTSPNRKKRRWLM